MTTRSDVVACGFACAVLLLFIACAAVQRPTRQELTAYCAVQAYRMRVGEQFLTVKADAQAQFITIHKKDSLLTCTALVR